MSPKAAYMAASIISYMGLNMAYQFAFAALTLPDAKKITDVTKFDPTTDQATAQDIYNNGGGINIGTAPRIDPETGQLTNVTHILWSDDEAVGLIFKGLNVFGGDQHIGIILKGLSTKVDFPALLGANSNSLAALSQGYLTAWISHTAVNISLLQWGSTMTIGSIGGGWTTAVSTFVYGPYGGGLTGAMAYEQIEH